jgi:hypothetical protein
VERGDLTAAQIGFEDGEAASPPRRCVFGAAPLAHAGKLAELRMVN